MVNTPAVAIGIRDTGSNPGIPWRGNENPPQYSCLEDPMGRGAWRAAVRGVAESDPTDRRRYSMRYPHSTFLPLFPCDLLWQGRWQHSNRQLKPNSQFSLARKAGEKATTEWHSKERRPPQLTARKVSLSCSVLSGYLQPHQL